MPRSPRLWVNPSLGRAFPRKIDAERFLASVAHADVQTRVTALSKEHSPATVQKIHRVLSQVLDLAVRDGRLARNVATGVNLPRVTKHAAYDTRTNTTCSATAPSSRSP